MKRKHARASKRALIVIDVGNTSTTLGLAIDRKLVKTRRVPTHNRAPVSVFRKGLCHLSERHDIEGAVLCSVVPSQNRLWLRILRERGIARRLVVTQTLNLGITIDYPRPETIGVDRLANACEAQALYGAPVIVADFGTALTFDIVSEKGAYIGGIIAPGLPLMTDYLAERTALLPHITVMGRCGRVGRSTVEAMRIGASIGYRGMVREILASLHHGRKHYHPRLVATGGYAGMALKGLTLPIIIDPDLTLKGLIRIYELNPPK